jgi:hypothetical protein
MAMRGPPVVGQLQGSASRPIRGTVVLGAPALRRAAAAVVVPIGMAANLPSPPPRVVARPDDLRRPDG